MTLTDKQWDDIREAANVVCTSSSIGKVEGEGFKVYKVVDIVRIDIKNKEKM